MSTSIKQMIGQATVVVAAAGATGAVNADQGVKSNLFDTRAPVVSIEDIDLFKRTVTAASVALDAKTEADKNNCHKKGAATASATPASAAKTDETEHPAVVLQRLNQESKQIPLMPTNTEEERKAKQAKIDELHAAQQKQMARMMQLSPGANAAANLSQLAGATAGGGKAGSAIATATGRQLQASSDPVVAACIDEVNKNYEAHSKSTPLQITFQDPFFEEAGRALKASNVVRSVFVELANGQRFNVVTKRGPYSSRTMPLEVAMKQSTELRASGAAPSFTSTGSQQTPTDPLKGLLDRSQTARSFRDALKGVEEAASAAKGK